MVDISSQNNKINVTVSSSGNTANTNVTPDYAQYYSEKSKEWAISNRIVDNTDYSSKYYANESKKQADISTAKATEVIESGNNAVSNIESARDNAIFDVNTAGATQVALATEQATIATSKTTEVVASGNAALANIDTAKNNAITSITNQETTSKTSLIDEGATQVGLIKNEGATQVANVRSTGFYMRDDKLYFINSQGEETEFKSGGSALPLLSIRLALYVDESLGLDYYLNGQLLAINSNLQGAVNELKKLKAIRPSLFCTEEEWQAEKEASDHGQVGKFVLNETAGTLRLPAVVNVQGLLDLQNLGMTVEAGLPNIKSENIGFVRSGLNILGGGAIKVTSRGQYSEGASVNQSWSGTFALNAADSSSYYKDGATVQPEAIQYPWVIRLATGQETEVNIRNDIELNNPYTLFDSKYSETPLYNSSWLLSSSMYYSGTVYVTAYEALLVEYNSEVEAGTTVDLPAGTKYTKRGLSVKLSTEEFTDFDFVLNTSDETFRLPLKTHTADDGNSVLTLYYYVGETVQNVNLIDAGRIGELVATKTDMLQASGAGMPSEKYIDLTLGASGSTYTAPANGWVYSNLASNTNDSISVISNRTKRYGTATRKSAGFAIALILPVAKGDVFSINYDGTATNYGLRFYYSKGSKEVV